MAYNIGFIPSASALQQAYFQVSMRLPIDDIKVSQRLERAYGILNHNGYQVNRNHDGSYTVYKESTSLLEDKSERYLVDKDSCSCYDYPTARAGLCKHRLAVMILEEVSKA